MYTQIYPSINCLCMYVCMYVYMHMYLFIFLGLEPYEAGYGSPWVESLSSPWLNHASSGLHEGVQRARALGGSRGRGPEPAQRKLTKREAFARCLCSCAGFMHDTMIARLNQLVSQSSNLRNYWQD